MNKETTIAIPADPNDPEDFDVSVEGVERGHYAREIRLLRQRLGFELEEFARAYDIPLKQLKRYERAQEPVPPAVRAYYRVIAAEPEMVRRVMAG